MNETQGNNTNGFVKYLQGIAPEGETILLVRQKPRIYDGEPVMHNDGSPRYSWVSYLPEQFLDKPRAQAGATYANTGCFILDRFRDGKLSFSAVNCERVAFLVLDDVGTKADEPPLEPTWKIETSPGNFQWGYTFALDDQPLKGEFSAAIEAIARAGFTDAGAINPVRNFRIPGSVNLKPGKDGFIARLVDFHPEREFSLPAICAALGVTPGEADTSSLRKIQLADDGNDAVLRWLRDNGHLIAERNPEGWYGVCCPNHAEHSDGNNEGRYNPVNRAYCCFHEHCGDWDSRRFLEWVDEQGGPKHAPGLRDELIAATMHAALERIQPTATFPDAAAAVVAEVERKELGRVQKAEWFERFAYVQVDDSYFDLVDRREIARGTFNALFRHIGCTSIHTTRRVEASVSFDENRQMMGGRVLEGITYAAGESILCAREGSVYGNRWRNARPDVSGVAPGDVSPWLDHLAVLVPEQAEREHLLNVMAFKVQFPAVKINHAILHAGTQGCGKDTLYAPFLWAVCGPHGHNRGLVDNDSINSQWGYQFESEILILNELKEPNSADRRALANKLKPLIAAPPDTITVNRKGLHPYDMVNRLLVMAYSNDRIPISLDSQDRRWFCIWSHAPRMDPDAAARLWVWYKSGGFEHIAAWLYARDVSAFNPAAAPPVTDYKLSLVENSASLAESFLVEMIRNRQGEFTRGAVGAPWALLCDRLAGSAPVGVKLVPAALLHALQESGWRDMGRIMSAEYTNKRHVFCAPELVKESKSHLRRLVEPERSPGLSIVK